MEPGGRLRIISRADDESVFLMFGDSGVGIRQEDLSQLFQPYHTTKPGGHGLGLMLVQRIMRAHGGQVGIESKEGVGTVVTLSFPQKNRRVRMLEAAIHERQPGCTRGKNSSRPCGGSTAAT